MWKNSLMLMAIALLAFACAQAPESDEAKTTDAQEVDEKATEGAADFAIDTKASQITWVGTKPVGRHNGSFAIKEGAVKVEGEQIVGGSFVIDINTLTVLDIPADDEGNGKLKGHLLSGDFFEAEKFPTAKFEITKVEAYQAPEGGEKEVSKEESEFKLANPTHTVSGNLELKGVSKNITFPAKISIAEGKLTAEAKFNINRKDWQMSYGADESLGDKFIRPTVHIGFNVVANK
ncbi:MAG: YceI family protein [Microscillaceae bacterium]|nr:YceI family protein [Microscillaceae bacterium]